MFSTSLHQKLPNFSCQNNTNVSNSILMRLLFFDLREENALFKSNIACIMIFFVIDVIEYDRRNQFIPVHSATQ